MDLESVTLVLLPRGPRADDFTEEELEALQEQHLGYQDDMRRRGHLAAAGPFGDQPDPSLRGISIYLTDLEKTRRLTDADPMVRAGRLSVDVMLWWFPAGEVVFPRARSQTREELLEGVFFGATPGPGNSEGGDAVSR
jgi:uncharacterized protein YciI